MFVGRVVEVFEVATEAVSVVVSVIVTVSEVEEEAVAVSDETSVAGPDETVVTEGSWHEHSIPAINASDKTAVMPAKRFMLRLPECRFGNNHIIT